jgi:hypothetical protein
MNKDDEAFDAAMRQNLRSLPVPEGEEISMPRRDFLRFGVAAGIATIGVTGWTGWQYQQTPTIVQQAFAHVHEESGLRGALVSDAGLRAMLGMASAKPFPGAVQLCKSCVIGGHAAWHLNTYLDNLGVVQVLAFKASLPDAAGDGHWFGRSWRLLSLANRHGASSTPEHNSACAGRFPHPNPLPEGEGTNESLRDFHCNGSKVLLLGGNVAALNKVSASIFSIT